MDHYPLISANLDRCTNSHCLVYSQVDESDSVPYHPHHESEMRPMEQQLRRQAHLIPRSVSEEVQLARMSGVSGPYDRLVEDPQYPEDYRGRSPPHVSCKTIHTRS